MTTFRKLPVDVEAVRFFGGNFHEIWEFVGTHPARDNTDWPIKNFNPIGTYSQSDDLEIVAEVWDELHSTWVGVKAGQWIIRGIKGEFYPCDDEVFRETYLEVDDSAPELTIEQELTSLLNRYSAESVSGTPDYILAGFLMDTLRAFNEAVSVRAVWRSESVDIPALQALSEQLEGMSSPIATADEVRLKLGLKRINEPGAE